MSGITAQILNQVLRQAGISEQSLEVLNCDAGQPCRIRYQVDASLQEKTFSTLPELFDWVNTSSYAAKLFTPLNDKWVLVDIDRQRPGSEALLYFANGAWRLTPQEPQGRVGEELSEEIFRLARVLFSSKDLDKAWKASRSDTHWFLQTLDKFVGKTWSRLGLQAAPQRFRDFSFALGSRPDSKKILPEFLSPLHDVYLTSSDSRKLVKVPWSDPFLMMEWQAYLLHAGVEVRRDKKNPEVFLYSFKGLPLMRLTREPRRWTCEIYSPLGAKIGETSWPRPAAPKIQVRPLAGETSTYGVKIDDLEVKFRFDLAFKVPEQGIEKFAAFAGQIFAGIPRSWLRTFLTKRQEESPFYVLVSDRKSAVEKEFVSQEVAEKCGGQYQPQVNRIWIPWDEDSLRQGLLFHEVAGHVLSDFAAADSNGAFLSSPGRSAIDRYYHWKLSELFSPEESARYVRLREKELELLLPQEGQESSSPKINKELFSPEEKKMFFLQKDKKLPSPTPGEKKDSLSAEERSELNRYRERALKKFVSLYAVEGPKGVNVSLPEEDFAEAATAFLNHLNSGEDWYPSRQQEPLLRLFGLHYLFSTYPVSDLRGLARDEEFSDKAFRQVLGLGVDSTTAKKSSYDFSSVISLGMHRISLSDGGFPVKRWTPQFGLRLGWKKQDWSAGALAEWSGSGDFDLGVWGRWSKPAVSLRFFLEPGIGTRTDGDSGSWFSSLWLENRLGAGFFSGRLEVALHHKTPLLGKDHWSEWGLGLGWRVK